MELQKYRGWKYGDFISWSRKSKSLGDWAVFQRWKYKSVREGFQINLDAWFPFSKLEIWDSLATYGICKSMGGNWGCNCSIKEKKQQQANELPSLQELWFFVSFFQPKKGKMWFFCRAKKSSIYFHICRQNIQHRPTLPKFIDTSCPRYRFIWHQMAQPNMWYFCTLNKCIIIFMSFDDENKKRLCWVKMYVFHCYLLQFPYCYPAFVIYCNSSSVILLLLLLFVAIPPSWYILWQEDSSAAGVTKYKIFSSLPPYPSPL